MFSLCREGNYVGMGKMHFNQESGIAADRHERQSITLLQKSHSPLQLIYQYIDSKIKGLFLTRDSITKKDIYSLHHQLIFIHRSTYAHMHMPPENTSKNIYTRHEDNHLI